MHLLFTQVHFLFWQPGQVGGQYTTCELVTEFSVHLFSGSFWRPLCIALLIVFSQPPSALRPGFQTAFCWFCDPALDRLRLEWIQQLAEKDVPNFISQSRSYPVILFTYTISKHLFRSCCVCFRWPNLRKSTKLYNPNIFIIYFSS